MAVEVLDPKYPQVNWVLLQVRQQLREGIESGEKGDFVTMPCPYWPGSIGMWQSGLVPKTDLTKLARKS